MKKALLAGMALLILFILSACGNGEETNNGNGDDDIFRVMLLVNGNLGDKSFFDLAVEGILELDAMEGIEASYIEMGTDASVWEPTLRTVSGQNYDLIFVGTWQMSENLQRTADRNPDQKYVIFDSEIEEDKNHEYPNVHSVLFDQSQASFLAGYAAASLSESMRLGFVGGQRIDTINDFAIGFIEGAELYAERHGTAFDIYASYVGSFDNSAYARSLAQTQYASGVDIIFQAAAQAGLGVFDAAKAAEKRVIGVDTDQYEYFIDPDPEKANLIVTSVLKRVDQVIVEAALSHRDGELEFAVLRRLGLADGIVGLARNDRYEHYLDSVIRDEIDALEADIIAGDIQVSSAYDLETSEINAILDRNRP